MCITYSNTTAAPQTNDTKAIISFTKREDAAPVVLDAAVEPPAVAPAVAAAVVEAAALAAAVVEAPLPAAVVPPDDPPAALGPLLQVLALLQMRLA